MLNEDQIQGIRDFCLRYKSHLNFDQISEGMELSLRNARSIYEDALLLLDNRRYGRAMSLLVACMEELGKVHVLQSMARIPKNNQQLWADAWAYFRDHEHKATIAIADTFHDEAREHPELIASAAMWQRLLAPAAERIRQAGLYTDFHATEKRWLAPFEVTLEDASRWLKWVETVLPKLERMRDLGLFSSKALKIQREVFGPINASRPRESKLTSEHLQTLFRFAPKAAQDYFRRLADDGVIPADADIQITGVCLSDLMKSEVN